jgi:drug/metabolite transporter (DMT)-like permease
MLRGLLWAGLTVACWTPLFSVAKRTLPHVDAFALGTLRYGIGVVLLVLILGAVEGRKSLRYDGRGLAATLFGVIGIATFNLCVWVGLGYTRPEHASVILAMQSPLIALTVWLTRGQRPAGFTLACVALAFAGVALVVTKGDPAAALAELGRGGALAGDLLVAAGAVCWMIYALGASRFPGWSPLRYTVLTCIPGLAGFVVANALAVAAGIVTIPSVAAVAQVGWQIAYFSICTVVLGVLGFNAATKRLGPLNTMLMLNLIPIGVFAIEAALGRRFAPIELAGALLVVGALVANNLYMRD